MPVALERVDLALDVVGEGGTLSEGVVALLTEVGVVLLENCKLIDGSSENIRVLGLEERLSSSGDYKMNKCLLVS